MSQRLLTLSWAKKTPRISNDSLANNSQVKSPIGTPSDTNSIDNNDKTSPEAKPSPGEQKQPGGEPTASDGEQKPTPTPPRQREAPKPTEVAAVPELDVEADTQDESSVGPHIPRLNRGIIISSVVVGMMISLYCAAAGAITGDYRPDFNVIDMMTVVPGDRWKNWVFLAMLTIAGIVCFSVPVCTRRVRLSVAILGAMWAIGWYAYLRYGEVLNTFDYTAEPTTAKGWLATAWPELRMAAPLACAYAALVSISSKKVYTPWTVRAGIPATIFLLVSLALVLIEGHSGRLSLG